MSMGKIGAAFAAVLAIAIEVAAMVYAPRCGPSSRVWPTIGGVIIIAGCPAPREEFRAGVAGGLPRALQ